MCQVAYWLQFITARTCLIYNLTKVSIDPTVLHLHSEVSALEGVWQTGWQHTYAVSHSCWCVGITNIAESRTYGIWLEGPEIMTSVWLNKSCLNNIRDLFLYFRHRIQLPLLRKAVCRFLTLCGDTSPHSHMWSDFTQPFHLASRSGPTLAHQSNDSGGFKSLHPGLLFYRSNPVTTCQMW